jgi:hypothetical protein
MALPEVHSDTFRETPSEQGGRVSATKDMHSMRAAELLIKVLLASSVVYCTALLAGAIYYGYGLGAGTGHNVDHPGPSGLAKFLLSGRPAGWGFGFVVLVGMVLLYFALKGGKSRTVGPDELAEPETPPAWSPAEVALVAPGRRVIDRQGLQLSSGWRVSQ